MGEATHLQGGVQFHLRPTSLHTARLHVPSKTQAHISRSELTQTSCSKDKVIDLDYQGWAEAVPKNYAKLPHSQRVDPSKPTFSEFVDFHLAGGTEHDNHVRSFVGKCDMCTLSYDVIARAETAEEDMAFIFAKTGLDRILPVDTDRNRSSGGSKTELALELFRRLRRDQFDGLVRYYRFDLEAFDYDISQFAPKSQDES